MGDLSYLPIVTIVPFTEPVGFVYLLLNPYEITEILVTQYRFQISFCNIYVLPHIQRSNHYLRKKKFSPKLRTLSTKASA